MKPRNFFSTIFVFAFLFCIETSAQNKAAFIVPQKNSTSEIIVEKLKENFAGNFKVIDDSLSETVFRSLNPETPFNLTTEQARNLGKAIGSELYIIVKAENWTRTSLERGTYQEAFAAVYAVSTRTGKLIFWQLCKAEEMTDKGTEKKFVSLADVFAKDFAEKTQTALNKEFTESAQSKIAELPDENSPEAKNFRPPLPFRRIKPEYTLLANLYSVTATVDIAVEIDTDGKILRTEILRWAGFGLDESVKETVQKMNWRAAERNGNFLPMRVVLRYNFKKIERED